MFRKSTARTLAFLCILIAGIAPAMAQQKIGFVNTLQVLSESEEGKGRIGAWEKFVETRQQQIAAAGTELQRLQEQFAQQAATLNPETQAEMQRSIEDKTTGLKRMQEDFGREAEAQRNQILQDVSAKMRAILEEYGQQNGFAAIFLRSPEQHAYVQTDLDLTTEVVRIYNEKHPFAATGSGVQGQ